VSPLPALKSKAIFPRAGSPLQARRTESRIAGFGIIVFELKQLKNRCHVDSE
jgi:hypothetical protein